MKFGLLMIVRDEAPIIKRALESVLILTDYWIICDTGSVDNTREIIKEFYMGKVEGELLEKEWKNFGYNKSFLMEEAYKVKDVNVWFWIDADEVLVRPDKTPLDKSDRDKLEYIIDNSKSNIFMFLTHYDGSIYSRWQAVKNNQKYWWNYPAHEILAATEYKEELVKHIINWARKQGNSSRDSGRNLKYVKWFEEYLCSHPKDPRALFYLAQSQQDSALIKEAKESYLNRLEVEGYQQEKYISLLRLGHLSKDYEKLSYYLRATYQFPKRLEAYYYAGIFLCHHNRCSDAIELLDRGLRDFVRDERNDLFVEWEIYQWKAKFQRAIAFYYVNRVEEGYQIIADMLSNKEVPENSVSFVKIQLDIFGKKILKYPSIEVQLNPAIVVVDNFVKNPDVLRKFALKQEYKVRGNYPGIRTESFATLQHKETFEKLLNIKIKWWPDGYNGSFQYVTKEKKTWFHRDMTTYSAILFLSPNPPYNSGTNIYYHKKLGLTYHSEEHKLEMDNDSNDPEAWVLTDKVENHYNRLVIFKGLKTHRADEYFGDSLETGRLFQIWFFS